MSKALEKTVKSIEDKLATLESAQKELETEIAVKRAQLDSMKSTIAGLERLEGKLG